MSVFYGEKPVRKTVDTGAFQVNCRAKNGDLFVDFFDEWADALEWILQVIKEELTDLLYIEVERYRKRTVYFRVEVDEKMLV